MKIARRQPAILDPALTRVRSFTHGSIGLMIVGMGEFGLVFLLPLALQAGAGLTAMEAGLLMLPTSVAAVAAFPLVQQLVIRTDQRTAVLAGLALEAAGLTGIAVAAEFGHPLAMLPGLAVYGLGIGAATAQLSALVLTEVPAARNSLASGLSSAARHLGSSLGVAVLGVLFSAPLAQVSQGLADQPVQTVAAMHDETLIARASDAVGHGVFVAGLAAAAFLLVGAAAIRGLPRTMAHPELAPSAA
jgi:MFS family permease